MPLSSHNRPLPYRRSPADRLNAHCRAALRQGSKSFFAASLLLPRAVREPASALYAFCRATDDAVDAEAHPTDVIERLRERLDRLYEDRPLAHDADRAFAVVARRFAIPKALPGALIEGFAWDAEARRYEDLAALNAYSARVAGSVGAMMALVMGVRDASAQARATDLGIAMQLTNIARDVGEDARLGRLYLPLAWMREAGLDPDVWLANPRFDRRLASVVERLIEAAGVLYERALPGIAALPLSCRPAIHLARLAYAEIGAEVARNGFDSVTRRAVVSPSRKLGLAVEALAATAAAPDPSDPALALPEALFLVEAASAAAAVVRPPLPAWQLYRRWIRIIEMFDTLERRERLIGEADVRV